MKTILLALALSLALSAQPFGYGGGRDNFAARIIQGERSGLLTPREANRLWDMERHYQRELARANRFGFEGRGRGRLDRMAAQLDFEITRQMRDGERAFRGPRGRW